MRLTLKQVRQIITEELDNILLNENLYVKNYNIMMDRIENEPEAQTGENSPMDQGMKMLKSNNDEELEMFLLAFSDDLPALAYQLFMSKDLESDKGQRFLGSIGRMGNQYPDAARLVEDYLAKRINNLKSKFEYAKDIGYLDGAYALPTLGKIARMLREDQVLSGYFGIVNASIASFDQESRLEDGAKPFEFLELEIDNEKNIKKIAELWLKNYGNASDSSRKNYGGYDGLLIDSGRYIGILKNNVGDKPNAMIKLRLSHKDDFELFKYERFGSLESSYQDYLRKIHSTRK